MKKFFFTVVLSFFLFACNKVFKNREGVSTDDSVKREYVLGADKDENGCIASAGFTWSVLKNDCIRIFEVGYRLNSVKTSLEEETVLSAFVIFNEDKNKVEIFLPNASESLILNETKENVFSKDNYIFEGLNYSLFKNDEKIFEGAKENLKNIENFEEEVE